MATPLVIGLTGGIGSGKSTVAALLAELGAQIIDADRVGHDVYLPGTEGFRRVVEAFGPTIVGPDGRIDRSTLGSIVFADPGALARLNALVHPLIGEEIRRRIARALEVGDGRPVVVEAAIMLEAGWRFFDRIWLVTVCPETAVARVVASRGLAPDAVRARLAAQMPDAERRRLADLVLENEGTPQALRARVEAAWRALVG